MSSLSASAVLPERFLDLCSGHWQVENRLHLVKDRWWEEDKHVLRRPGLGEVWSSLTSLALSVLWSMEDECKQITRRAIGVAANPVELVKTCGF